MGYFRVNKTSFEINGRVYEAGTEELQNALIYAHERKIRPRCLCVADGVEMCIAKLGDRYFIKRMPNTGGKHGCDCDSYEPPEELSGLGQVKGSAIVDDDATGETMLRVGFSMSNGAGRSPPPPSDKEKVSVTTEGNKLSLRALLHYLWEQGQLNRWHPGMAGKRNWAVVRKYLLQAAQLKKLKGGDLSQMLYIPETFSDAHRGAIAQRRIATTAFAASGSKFMLVVGEVKKIAESNFGFKLVLKHLPDWHFMMNNDMHKRLLKAFEQEIGMSSVIDGSHLVLIGTFQIAPAGYALLQEASLMLVNDNWLPFENLAEKSLLDELVSKGRRFIKGLRYNLLSTAVLASTVLIDTDPLPTATYLVPGGAPEGFQAELTRLQGRSEFAHWQWTIDKAMPDLPPEKGRRMLGFNRVRDEGTMR